MATGFEGLVINTIEGFVNFGELARRYNNESLKYIRGFVTHYTNGYVSVSDGGGASGFDLVSIYLLDEKGNIIYENETTY